MKGKKPMSVQAMSVGTTLILKDPVLKTRSGFSGVTTIPLVTHTSASLPCPSGQTDNLSLNN